MKLKYYFIILFCLITTNTMAVSAIENPLHMPAGQYSVGYSDMNWINQDVCPDPNYTGNNKADFNAENTKFCHELMLRIYYPSHAPKQLGKPYYPAFVQDQQQLLRQIPGIKSAEINELNTIQSYTTENAQLASNKQFPVIIFLPGFTFPAEVYENFITEIVSHGYIVVSVNSPFINLVAMKNGHVIKTTKTFDPIQIEKKYIPIQIKDLIYVYKQLKVLHELNPLFKAMDLQHIGVLGHSVGARVLADVGHLHPNYFQAAATFDIGFDTTGQSTKKFAFPFLHEIAADRFSDQAFPAVFELNRDNYLITMAKDTNDHHYTSHMNFSDLSTLQYLSAYKKALPFLSHHGMRMVGDGEGHQITEAINTYVIKFFDTYLKNQASIEFTKCVATVANTYIQCGGG